ncbi:hypothetical protein DPX16_9840 [Anabarilius grahami]|uniref:Uncharacterized protein n=1 Tax=Anabarilius grahami TaxID=495550 RepID=A0A3N0Y3R3_ANAGA|nr:hypothetical protein DPX16_9840 [Anabarilius grahami]
MGSLPSVPTLRLQVSERRQGPARERRSGQARQLAFPAGYRLLSSEEGEKSILRRDAARGRPTLPPAMEPWEPVLRDGAGSRKVAPARPQVLFGYGRLNHGLHKMLTNRKVECWLQWIVPVSLDAQQEQVEFGPGALLCRGTRQSAPFTQTLAGQHCVPPYNTKLHTCFITIMSLELKI